MKVGDKYYYYNNDHLGTPQKLTAGNGEVVWSAKYNSFGKAEVEIETIENNLRFAGQYKDTVTGLHYNCQRYYDAEIGKYLRTDPLGIEGGLNLFNYTDNRPVNQIDPLGLKIRVGGGFGFTAGLINVSLSIGTDTCCDDSGKLHLRTIESFCWGMRIGLGVKMGKSGTTGPGSASVSIGGNGKTGRCQGNFNPGPDKDLVYYTEDYTIAFSSGLVVGAAWSPKNPTTTTITAGEIGIGLTLSQKCRNTIINDVEMGCCNQ